MIKYGKASRAHKDFARLKYILQLKNTIDRVAEDYGGWSFLPQAHTIAFLLGDASLRSMGHKSETYTASTSSTRMTNRLLQQTRESKPARKRRRGRQEIGGYKRQVLVRQNGKDYMY